MRTFLSLFVFLSLLSENVSTICLAIVFIRHKIQKKAKAAELINSGCLWAKVFDLII